MHIHREPLYSFFLWIFRSLFGETKYLDIVRFLQNGLAAFSVIWLAESLKKRFDFGQWMEALVCLIGFAGANLADPTDITKVVDAAEKDALKIMAKKGIIESEFDKDC